MMKSHITPITEGKSHAFFASFDHALNQSRVSDALVMSGFAYATLGGTQHFISHVERIANWTPISKQFVIGIHHGITEPSALEMLRGVPNSEVRIFIPGERLTPESLIATPLFHPKFIAISDANKRALRFLQAGSANLTASAISDQPRNYELSISIEADKGAPSSSNNAFLKWWSRIWRKSRIVDKETINRYAKARLDVFERNPILRHAAGVPSNIRRAEYFFIEVGAASGPPGLRHQVEFPESLVAFFGRPARHRRDITLSRNGVAWSARPLSYKTTTFGVEIWRLGMPTQNTGGDPIANRAIRFRRTGKPHTFEFEVVDSDSSSLTEWRGAANTLGHLGATHGQRARLYGFY